jgi:hypothetical protein
VKGPTTIRLATVAVAALMLSGCFGDPPPDPASAPLEVVVGSSQLPDQPCLLNREEVAAGEHVVQCLADQALLGEVRLRVVAAGS